MLTIRVRSVFWFAMGVALTVIAAGVFVGMRIQAAPGPQETTFVPIAPCRLFDYRPATNVGPRVGALGPGEVTPQQVTGAVGKCNLPSSATGVSMNVTIAGPTAASFLTVFPANLATPPNASNLNWVAGQPPTANKVDVKLSPTGAIKLFNKYGTVFVIADVVGYYTRAGLADLQSQLNALRTQTVTFSGYDMQTVGSLSTIIGSTNSCAVMYDSQYGFLSLPLPLGATITSVTASIYPASSFTIEFERRTSASAGESATPIGSASGTSGGTNVVVDITPPSEQVDADERFTIRFNDGTSSFGAGLCSVTVSYRLPGG